MIGFLKSSLVLVVLLVAWVSHGQAMEAYLRTALQDQSLERFQAQLEFLGANNYSLPWLNRVELRVGSEGAGSTLNDYRVRFSPTNPREIKANKTYHSLQIRQIETNYQVSLNQALKTRYLMLIAHRYMTLQKNLMEGQLAQLKKLTTLSVQTTPLTESTDWIRYQRDQTQWLLDLADINFELKEAEYWMRLDLPEMEQPQWEQISWIGTDQIAAYLLQRPGFAEGNLYARQAEDQRLLEEQMMEVSLAESRKNIGYLQGNLDTDRGTTFQDGLGIQLGLRVPLVNPEKADINRDRVDLIEARDEAAATKLMLARQSGWLQLQLTELLNRIRLLEERLLVLNHSVKADPTVTDVEWWVKRTHYETELRAELLQTERELMDMYIECLDQDGALVQQPLVNHLSANRSPIEAGN